jgi:parallel beta-helix repeat protein
VNSTGSISSGARAWIYGNIIECHENGNGIIVPDTDEVIIGEDYAGNAGNDQRNIIRLNGVSGVRFEGGSGNVVRNSTITNNGESGVHITNSDLNRVFGNTIAANGDNGVEIVNGSQLNRIGCPAGGYNNATYQNQIRTNTNEGVWIYGGQTANNSINCNRIGLTVDGNGAAGNGRSGILISGGANGNFVGVNDSTRNVIGGNGRYGVEISGDGTDNNGVYGNFIGTNVVGNTAVPNLSGVVISLGASNNRVGDTSNDNGGQNLISGNDFIGIFIGDNGTTGNRIEGNYIGGNGGSVPANGRDGIRIVGADGNSIGDNADEQVQSIMGNGRNGIRLEDTSHTVVGLQNYITDNSSAGIVVTSSSTQNDLWPRLVYENGGLPIDLGDDGHSPNDDGDGDSGPNNLLNYPEATDINGNIVSGTVCGGCTVRIYSASLDPSQPGGGGVYRASVTADFDGNWSVNLNDLGVVGITADDLTYTAVQSFNTSEMSPRSLSQIFLPVIMNNAPLPGVPDQVWFAPNMGSRDYTDLFTHPAQWLTARAQIDVFKFYTQNLIDAPCDICGSNTLNAFVTVQAFQKLTNWGIAIAVEAGAVKEWGCTGEREAEVVEEIIGNVQANGGTVTYLAMDEPYIGGELVINGHGCGYTMSQSADATTYFINRVRSADPAIVLGDIEPYPYFSIAQLQQWIMALESRGVQLDFFHLDVDIERVSVEGQDVAADLWTLNEFCQSHGIPFGVIFTSTWTEAGDEDSYFASTMDWIDTVNNAMGMPSHAIFQSWQGPAPDGVHAVPLNLPENDTAVYSHTQLINKGQALP